MGSLSPLEIKSKDLVTVDIDDSVLVAHHLMRSKKIRHLIVTIKGKAIGVLSDRDLMKALRLEIQDFLSITVKDESYDPKLTVRDVMGWPIKSIDESRPLIEVVDIILEQKISSVLITRDLAVVGIVTTEDLIGILKHHLNAKEASFWGEEIVNKFYATPLRVIMELLSNTGI